MNDNFSRCSPCDCVRFSDSPDTERFVVKDGGKDGKH